MAIGNGWAEGAWIDASWVVGAWQYGDTPEPPVTPPTGGGGSIGTVYENRKYYERQARRKAEAAKRLSKPKKRAEIKKAIAAVPEIEKKGWTADGEAKLVELLLKDAVQFEQVMIKYYELLLKEAAEIERINNQKMDRLKQDDEAMAAILLSAW